ncbi:iron ABC transporter permease [Candidatus Geothermarchaeota archaeon]|nr:MAG: iron ABC transporter permease [Candidatus Geothermarchaeota archaeon]
MRAQGSRRPAILAKLSAISIKQEIRNLKWQFDPFSLIQLLSVLTFFSLFLIIPVLSVTYKAFFFEGTFTTRWFYFILSDEFYLPIRIVLTDKFPFIAVKGISGQFFRIIGRDILYIQGVDMGVILNSLMVASMTTIFTTIIGVSLAFIFARYRFFGSNILKIILLVPLLSTPFIGAIGIKRMIGHHGVLNTIFYDILHILPYRIVIDGLAAVVVVQTLLFYPIVFLNAYTAMINIDPSLEEQAESLGSSGFNLFRTITLPLATPGIEAGALLVFILSLEDLGTPIVFSGTNAAKLMTYQIFVKMFTPAGYIREDAVTLALILLIISALIFIVIRKYVSLKRYAMLSKGGIWRPRIKKLSWKVTIFVYLYVIIILFFATLPHVGVTLLAFAGKWSVGILPDYFSIKNFQNVFTDPETLKSITNSLTYSLIATVIIVVLGVSAAYLVSRKKVAGIELLDTLVTIPIALPGIVIATGLLLTYLNTPLTPVISAAPLLIASYSIRKSPFTIRAVFAGLEQTDVELEEVAISIGASKARVFFTITAPLVLINIIAGSMLSFIYSMSEVSTGIVIGAANPPTAPMTWKMYDLLASGLGGGTFNAAAMGFILMTLQFIMIVGSNLLLRRRATALISV